MRARRHDARRAFAGNSTLGDGGTQTGVVDTDVQKAFLEYAKSFGLGGTNGDCVARTAAAWWVIDSYDLPDAASVQVYFSKALDWMVFAVRSMPMLGPNQLPLGDPSYGDTLLAVPWGIVPWPAVLPLSATAWASLTLMDWPALDAVIKAKYGKPANPQGVSPVLIPWTSYPDIPWITTPWRDVTWWSIPWTSLNPTQPVTSQTVLNAASAGALPPKADPTVDPNRPGGLPPGWTPPGGGSPSPDDSGGVKNPGKYIPRAKPCQPGYVKDAHGVCQPACASTEKLVNGHCVRVNSSGNGGTDTTKTDAAAPAGMSTGTKVAIGLGATAVIGTGLWLAFGKKRSKR
jgi:hypothetical protein